MEGYAKSLWIQFTSRGSPESEENPLGLPVIPKGSSIFQSSAESLIGQTTWESNSTLHFPGCKTLTSECVHAKLPPPTLCDLRLFVSCDHIDCSLQGPLSMGFSRQKHWSVLPFPTPGNLPNGGIEPVSLKSPELADGFFTNSATWKAPH